MNRSSTADSVPQGVSNGLPEATDPDGSTDTEPLGQNLMRNRGVVSQKRGDGCGQSVWELGYDFRIVSEQALGAAEIIDATTARRQGHKNGGLCFSNRRRRGY